MFVTDLSFHAPKDALMVKAAKTLKNRVWGSKMAGRRQRVEVMMTLTYAAKSSHHFWTMPKVLITFRT